MLNGLILTDALFQNSFLSHSSTHVGTAHTRAHTFFFPPAVSD